MLAVGLPATIWGERLPAAAERRRGQLSSGSHRWQHVPARGEGNRGELASMLMHALVMIRRRHTVMYVTPHQFAAL